MKNNKQHSEDKLILKKLASYTGVAAAAVLLLPANSRADVHYFDPEDIIIDDNNTSYGLDINNDNYSDFKIGLNTDSYYNSTYYTYFYSFMTMSAMLNINYMIASNDFIKKLPENMTVGPDGPWDNVAVFCHGTGFYFGTSIIRGDWKESAEEKFIGVKFKISGKDHYGWIRASVASTMCYMKVTIHDWAYEDKPGVSIKTGQTENSSY